MPDVPDRTTIKANLTKLGSAWSERIEGWRATGQQHTEKSFAQQFWSDLLRCFGIIPERIDLFERDARRASTGNTGYIDFFWSGVAIGEAKKHGDDLQAAFDQALDYLAGGSLPKHEWPRYVLVTNFESLRIDRLGDDQWTVTFPINEAADHIDQLRFLTGEETITKREEEQASIDAARLMANLYTAMLGEDADAPIGEDAPESPDDEDDSTEHTSILMTRILFLLYGDDAGLWEEDLFYRWVDQETTPSSLGPQLRQLFEVLDTPEGKRSNRLPDLLAKFPYVNGSIYGGAPPTEYFTPETREALLGACRFRWTQVSPAIFGSMFQLVKSKEARRASGEHYTSETNILKTLGPLFLDGYRAKADRLIQNKTTTLKELEEFLNDLASDVFCDPACGSGNFLNLAYAKLREIETDIIVDKRRRSLRSDGTMSMDVTIDQRLSINQFHGFEIHWWPAKIAETAMFLVDHQSNRKLADAIGQAPDRLPITITAHIVHGDALTLIDWGEALPETTGQTYIFGNPPFVGHRNRTDSIREGLVAAWGESPSGQLDYVTGWHAKSMRLLADREGEFAFVTTNSIAQGKCVAPLFGPLAEAGWRIKFAHQTFFWDSEAPGKAAVHCVIIGFTRNADARQRLWSYDRQQAREVMVRTGINPYLLDAPWVIVTPQTTPISPQLPSLSFGTMAIDRGHLTVKEPEYAEFAADPTAAPYLRPYLGADEILHNRNRWCLWLEGVPGTTIAKSPLLRRRVEGCQAYRTSQGERFPNGDAYKNRDTPALMRINRSRPEVPYLAIPRHFSGNYRYLPVTHLPPEVIGSDALFQAEDPDGFMFALLSSSMYMAWQNAVGGELKSDPRFGKTTTWHTFPIPDVTPAERQRIIQAGRRILDARNQKPELSLADAYNPLGMDPALIKAHDALDREVDKAFGAPRKLSLEPQRQELLFARYAELAMQ